MKNLTLIRHAKSSWKHLTLSDWERPLKKRGVRDAHTLGQRLAEKNSGPDLMISSPAARAMATAEAIAEEIGYPPDDIVVDERIYGADVDDLIEVVWGLDDALEHVTLLGHNPSVTEFANTLSPRAIGHVPTCGIIELQFDTDVWAQVGRIRPTHVSFDYPKRPIP